jgi:hypothetical protein
LRLSEIKVYPAGIHHNGDDQHAAYKNARFPLFFGCHSMSIRWNCAIVAGKGWDAQAEKSEVRYNYARVFVLFRHASITLAARNERLSPFRELEGRGVGVEACLDGT